MNSSTGYDSGKVKWGMKKSSEFPKRNLLSQLNQHRNWRREIKLSALVFPRIHSSLEELELMENKSSSVDKLKFKVLKHWLRNLRTFLLCAKKLVDKDQNLDALLRRIEHEVRSSLPESRPIFGFKGGPALQEIIHFRQQIKCFEEEIAKWYITLSSFPNPSTNEVMEFTDSLLENLVDFFSFSLPGAHKEFLVELALALKEEITFLRNIIRFAMLRSVHQELLKILFTRLETISVNAAHLSYMCQRDMDDKEWRKEMQSNILGLLQMIEPNDPQVFETYTLTLTLSKLLGRSNDQPLDMNDSPTIIMKDFIDSLICNLWKILKLESSLVVFEKDLLQELYEGLRFLRTILKEQRPLHMKELLCTMLPFILKERQCKFDAKLMDLTVAAICDAGLVIFFHSQKNEKKNDELVDSLARIKLIMAEVEENAPQTSKFNHPRTNELGFVDSVLENLTELTSCNVHSNAQSGVQTIQEELIFLRSFLGEIVELHNEHEELQTLWNCVVEVAYRVEFLIDPMMFGDIPKSFSMSIDSITEDVRNIKANVLRIFHGEREEIKIKKVTRASNQLQLKSSALIDNEVVGFDDEAISIIDRVARGSKQLQVVAIVGMPGIGKTTLATKVYNDLSIMSHFHVRTRCSISQVLDKKKMLLELLNHIVTKFPDRYFEFTEQDLVEELWRRLKGYRYLIFLDDVWDIEVWNSLEGSLPDDGNGSRIILTSRLFDVAPQAKLGRGPHFLRKLTNDESWKLLQRRLLPGNAFPPKLYELGMQIAENCKGVPLTIVIVAGILSTMEQEGWKEVLKSLHLGIISGTEHCMNTLELSYKHLPDYLKPCFLYFGAFPEDHEISVKRLIQLWIAEGFVRKTNLKRLEESAADYLVDLISRSLVTVANERSIGGVKTCRIHDLIHDFCLTKAKEEKFFHLLKGYDELLDFNEPCHLWRLCIYSKPKHFKESKLFCPRARSLLFFSQTERYERTVFDISFIIHIFRFLGVLDLEQIHLGSVFPSEMGLLVHLKYLTVQGEMELIPSSIGNLSKLETFIVNSLGRKVSLPDTLWNLQRLRHLYIRVGTYDFSGFSLPIDNLDNSFGLHELDSFSGAIISSWNSMEKQLRKFPNILKLKCKLFEYGDNIENSNVIIIPDFLSRLESLDLSPFGIPQNHVMYEFAFPSNLRKLTLSRFGLPWEAISTIAKLPNLEVLKLLNGSFSGKTWDVMEDGDFSNLRFLKLASLNIVRWTASDDQFPCLRKLILERCNRLEEIPSCLENISTLELIEVRRCSLSVVSLVKGIQEEQMNMGNLVKILFNPPICSS